MDDLRRYILSVLISALLCGIIPFFLQKGMIRDIVKAVCGLVLTICVISPVRNLESILPNALYPALYDSGAAASAEGEAMSREALSRIIKDECEAYILDKATELNVTIDAQILLSQQDPPVPESAVISGAVSPYIRNKLQEIICTHLSIAKEDITWTG